MKLINFNKLFRSLNIFSIILVTISIIFISIKGLNYGVDFKGGSLIEIRVNDQNIKISNIRDLFNQMNLNGLSVKQFGNETDYIIKFNSDKINNPDYIKCRSKGKF